MRATLEEHKAEEIVVIELEGKSTIGDFMVIASGNSSRQVAALTDHLLRLLKQRGLVGLTPEGLRQSDWVLIDAGDIIIHLFRPEIREFYNLEKMWSGPIAEQDLSAEEPAGTS